MLKLISICMLTLASPTLASTTDADGNYAVGLGNRFDGTNNIALGIQNTIKGMRNQIIGQLNKVNGIDNMVDGQGNIVHGDTNQISGQQNIVHGSGNIILSSQDTPPITNTISRFDVQPQSPQPSPTLTRKYTKVVEQNGIKIWKNTRQSYKKYYKYQLSRVNNYGGIK